jgi:predicted small secreted protein
MMMRKILLLAACALAMPLAACDTVGGIANSIPAVGQYTTVCANSTADEKALYAVEAAYNVPAGAYRSANSRGLITPTLKAQIKPKLQTLAKYVLGAREARKACNMVALGQYQEAAETLKAGVLPLIPR